MSPAPRMSPTDLGQWLLLSALWGVSFLLIKWLGESFSPAAVALLRSGLGAVFLWGALILGRRHLPPARLWKPLLVVAVLNNALPWTLFAWGEHSVPSNLASILNATTPLFSLLIALATREAGASLTLGAGVLLGLGGVALTVSGGVSGGHASLLGAGALLAATLSYAVATAIAKRAFAGLDPVGLATSQLSLSALLLLPLAVAGGAPGPLSPRILASALFLGLFGSGLAYLLYYGLLARVSATQVTAVTYLLPLWGLLWGALAGEETLLIALVGAGVTLLGLALVTGAGRPGTPGVKTQAGAEP